MAHFRPFQFQNKKRGRQDLEVHSDVPNSGETLILLPLNSPQRRRQQQPPHSTSGGQVNGFRLGEKNYCANGNAYTINVSRNFLGQLYLDVVLNCTVQRVHFEIWALSCHEKQAAYNTVSECRSLIAHVLQSEWKRDLHNNSGRERGWREQKEVWLLTLSGNKNTRRCR